MWKGLRWRSGESAHLSPLRWQVRFSVRTFSMLLEPTQVDRVSQHSAESCGFVSGYSGLLPQGSCQGGLGINTDREVNKSQLL